MIALSLATTFAFAQAKKDTVKKAVEYKADPARVYDIHLQLTSDQISILSTPEHDIETSSKLTGEQITAIKDFLKETRKEINKQAYTQALADYQKFKADTAKKIPAKKGKK